MQPIWWLLIIAGLMILFGPWSAVHSNESRSRAQKLAAQRRLRRFEQEERIHQHAAAMRRVREINELAYRTRQAMLQAALDADREAKEDCWDGRCE